MSQQDQDRRIDYIEFPVSDVAETKRFYATVFGWSFTDYGPDYTCFTDGRMRGGFAKSDDVVPGGPLVVLYAADLAGVEMTIVELGGKIVKKTYEFPGGKRFHFRDLAGHELAVWSER
ncbi:MAG: VOC family protein [bacterium]|nr:VOC family protein [bacterium]